MEASGEILQKLSNRRIRHYKKGDFKAAITEKYLTINGVLNKNA